MSALPPILVELKANASEFMAKMGEARKEVGKLGTEGSARSAKFASVGKAALLGFAGVAVGVGLIAVKAAMEGEVAHAALAQAVKNTGASMESVEPKVEGLTGKFAKLGYSRAELEQGLTVLTTSLKSPTKALADIGIAADLARYKHISLADASLVVAKATEGQLKPMKALGIDLPVVAGGAAKLEAAQNHLSAAQSKLSALQYIAAHTVGKEHVKALHDVIVATGAVNAAQTKLSAVQGTSKTITEALAAAVRGQASAAAGTYAGKLNAAKAAATNMAENLGNVLLPIIARLIGNLSQAVSWLDQHRGVLLALAAAIGGPLVIAIGFYIQSLVMASVAQIKTFAEGIAQGAVWVATKVAQFASAVAAGAVYIANLTVMGALQVKTFTEDIARGVVWLAAKVAQYAAAAAAGILAAVTTAAAWVAANIAMIAATGGIVLALAALVAAGYFVVTHWKEIWNWIKEAASAAWSFLRSVFSAIVNVGLAPIRMYMAVVRAEFQIAWAVIKLAIAVAWAAIKVIFDLLTGNFGDIGKTLGSLKGAFGTAWDSIKGAISGAWSVIEPIINAIESAFSGLMSVAGTVIDTLGKVGGAVGKVGHFLHIPGLATGGYVTSPTLAVVGEGREPEYVLPESKLNSAVKQASAQGGGGGGGVTEVHLYIDGQEVHTAVRKVDRQFRLRNGQSAFA